VTTLVLVRHGKTPATGKRLGGHTQASLSDEGREEARAAAGRIAELPLAAVYASPLPRAWETAELVAEPSGQPVSRADGLIEVDFGEWTDRELARLAKLDYWRVVQNQPSRVTFPGGESLRGAQIRAVDACEDLVAAHPNGIVAAVSHADVIKLVVAFYAGIPMDNFQRLGASTASTSVVSIPADGGRPAIGRLNDDGPLQAPAQPDASKGRGGLFRRLRR